MRVERPTSATRRKSQLGAPAFSDGMWENYTASITWQASQRNKINFRRDEQPVCPTSRSGGCFA
jgi:hypothetical protein